MTGLVTPPTHTLTHRKGGDHSRDENTLTVILPSRDRHCLWSRLHEAEQGRESAWLGCRGHTPGHLGSEANDVVVEEKHNARIGKINLVRFSGSIALSYYHTTKMGRTSCLGCPSALHMGKKKAGHIR